MSPTRPVVLCAVDGGPTTVAVLRRGAALAQRLGVPVAVVHVARRVPTLAPEIAAVDLAQDAAFSLFPVVVEALLDATVPWTLHARDGVPASEIADLARDLGAEFVVVGAGRRTWWRRHTLVERVTASLACPVVVVPRHDHASQPVGQTA